MDANRPAFRRTETWFALLLFFYAALLIPQLSRLSLWLDEIIDLQQIRDLGLYELIRAVPVNAGGVPLSYLVRAAFIHCFGYSALSGRLPSLLFSLVSAVGVFFLARQLRLRFPLLPVVLVCLMPLQLRFAVESRPYSPALAITVWATVVFRQHAARPRVTTAALYAALALLGLYTQPYTVFVFVAHFVWICCAPALPSRRALLLSTGAALGIAAVAFLPWQLWALSLWNHASAQNLKYTADMSSLRVLAHELVGGGYFGSILTLGLAALGITLRLRGQPDERLFWGLYLLLPIALALAADRLFGYFFAVRQTIEIAVPLAILAASGIQALFETGRLCAWLLLLATLATFSIADVQLLRKPHEDWQAAALTLEKQAGPGSCILFTPEKSAGFYYFFLPELAHSRCQTAPPFPPTVLLAKAPYDPALAAQTIQMLQRLHYSKTQLLTTGTPVVEKFVR